MRIRIMGSGGEGKTSIAHVLAEHLQGMGFHVEIAEPDVPVDRALHSVKERAPRIYIDELRTLVPSPAMRDCPSEPIPRWRLKEDGDGHSYLIPVGKEEEWEAWRDLDDDDEQAWYPPDFAVQIDNPYTLTFVDPQEDEGVLQE